MVVAGKGALKGLTEKEKEIFKKIFNYENIKKIIKEIANYEYLGYCKDIEGLAKVICQLYLKYQDNPKDLFLAGYIIGNIAKDKLRDKDKTN